MQAIVPYRPEWREAYRGLVAEMRPAFPNDAIFHHIGSTAVPGLPAKDVIDIQATVGSLASVDAAALAPLGFAGRLGPRSSASLSEARHYPRAATCYWID